jgi:hypothetical protein
MPITAQLTHDKVRKIFVTRYAAIDPKEIKANLAHLAARGRITDRDERLLELLREVTVLSLDQVRRLLWPEGQESTAYNRLYFLSKQQLLSGVRVPLAGMREWGLPSRKVYGLGVGGWLWLREEVNQTILARHLKREQVLHDLLVAEFYVRLVEAAHLRGQSWTVTWVGEEAASYLGPGNVPIIAPDGLAILREQRGDKVGALPLFLEFDKGREAHGRPSSDWGRKVQGYDRFHSGDWAAHPQLANLPAFPLVAVITHGQQRLLNLTQAILKHRREPVVYKLAVWEDLSGAADMLAAPAWLTITESGEVIGQERAERQGLLPPIEEKRKRARNEAREREKRKVAQA